MEDFYKKVTKTLDKANETIACTKLKKKVNHKFPRFYKFMTTIYIMIGVLLVSFLVLCYTRYDLLVNYIVSPMVLNFNPDAEKYVLETDELNITMNVIKDAHSEFYYLRNQIYSDKEIFKEDNKQEVEDFLNLALYDLYNDDSYETFAEKHNDEIVVTPDTIEIKDYGYLKMSDYKSGMDLSGYKTFSKYRANTVDTMDILVDDYIYERSTENDLYITKVNIDVYIDNFNQYLTMNPAASLVDLTQIGITDYMCVEDTQSNIASFYQEIDGYYLQLSIFAAEGVIFGDGYTIGDVSMNDIPGVEEIEQLDDNIRAGVIYYNEQYQATLYEIDGIVELVIFNFV